MYAILEAILIYQNCPGLEGETINFLDPDFFLKGMTPQPYLYHSGADETCLFKTCC